MAISSAPPRPGSEARASRRPNLTEWDSPRELARIVFMLSLPVAATNALQTLIGFVDTRMVSELGRAALPALGVGRTAMFFLASVFMGMGVGITAYVSRLTGAGEHDKARQFATVGVLFSGALGVLMMLVGLLWGEAPAKLMVTSEGGGVDPRTAALTQQYAWDYMRIMFISLGGVGIQFAALSVFNSLGRTTFPMWLLVMNNIANFLGNWYLIPRYEVEGAAIATLITMTLSGLVGLMLLQRQGAVHISPHAVFDWPRMRAALGRGWEMFRLGAPVTIQVLARSMSMLTMLKLITYLPNSVTGQSALQVGLQVESLAFMPAFAFSTAAATLVGQNLGAKKPAQARQSVWFCLIGSQIVMGTVGLAQFIWPEQFIRLFIGNNAPEVVAPAAEYVRILALCLPGLGLGLTMMGALRGAGDTKITAYISLGAMYLFRIPLAVLLSMENIGGTGLGLGWGLSGLWWAMTASVYVEAFLAWLRFRSGRWAEVKLGAAHERVIGKRLGKDEDAQLFRDVDLLEAESPTRAVVPADPLFSHAPRQPEAVVRTAEEYADDEDEDEPESRPKG